MRMRCWSGKVRMARVGCLLAVLFTIGLVAVAQGSSVINPVMGESAVADYPWGIPANPASATNVGQLSLHAGAVAPGDGGWGGYVALQESRDPRGMGAALPGILGVERSQTVAGRDPVTDEVQYKQRTTYSYQLADEYGEFGALGVGVRFVQEQDSSLSRVGQSWHLDLGWQQALTSNLRIGVTGRGVAGTATKWSDGAVTGRDRDILAGAALRLGTRAYALAEVSEFRGWQPSTWTVGMGLSPSDNLHLQAGYRLVTGGEGQFLAGLGLSMGRLQISGSASFGATAAGAIGLSAAL